MIKRVDKRLQAVQCLTGNKIKIIACITMLIDHFSKIFLESIMNDKLFPLYLAGGMSTEQFYGIDAFQKNILNGIGTIAFPLFCLLLSEGFFYTKNRKRYIGGMLAFALISEVPFDIGFFSRYSIAEGTFPFYLQYQNVFFTLFLGLLTLVIIEKVALKISGEGRKSKVTKILCQLGVVIIKQQGFEGLGRKQTEWKAWMEREKEALTEIAQAHEFEIISLGGGRPHMELPEYRAAAQRLEAVQEQVIAAEQEIAALEKQRKALQGNVKLLKAVEKVKPDLDAIQPEKTLTGAVKGVTVEQVKELKAAVIRGAAAEQKVRELKVENQQLQQKIPSMKEKLKEAQERKRLENENRQLKVQVEYLEKDLSWERGISARLQEGIGAVLDFLDQHLPEQFRPLVEKARELLPVPEVQQPEREQERGHTWGGMEL